jgi:hypothetical protein
MMAGGMPVALANHNRLHGHDMSQYFDGLRRRIASFKRRQSLQICPVVESHRSLEIHES